MDEIIRNIFLLTCRPVFLFLSFHFLLLTLFEFIKAFCFAALKTPLLVVCFVLFVVSNERKNSARHINISTFTPQFSFTFFIVQVNYTTKSMP